MQADAFDFQEAELVPDSAGAAQKLSTVIPRQDCLAATPWQDGTGDRMQSDQPVSPSMKSSLPPPSPLVPTLYACVSMDEQ